ncbi:hypothetical protein GEMRC1_009381 [Eukaryota sp. GEM-RC1]
MISTATAVDVIQRCWKSFSDRTIFAFYKDLLSKVNSNDPQKILRAINPVEAKILDRSLQCHVRFRLSGFSFPPTILYRVYTHGNIADINSFAPRDYQRSDQAKVPARTADKSGWYNRNDEELNPWRVVGESCVADLAEFSQLTLPSSLCTTKEVPEWHWSKLQRVQDVKKLKKQKRLAWRKKLYSQSKRPPSSCQESSSDEELVDWTQNLDFDSYLSSWQNLSISMYDLSD